jgi:hypothetical protein
MHIWELRIEIEKFVLVQQTFGSEKQDDSGDLNPNIRSISFSMYMSGVF